ncbi:TPA: RHS repeat domain-containing protein, partial [Burkholderia cepacia]
DGLAWYQCDHLGTPQELTDEQSEIAWSAEYRAWGVVKEALHKASDGRVELRNPIRFQGQYHDQETGLHYNRHRYYDPNSGRFISKDPIGIEGGINVYAYVKNPIVWIDPLGLQATGPALLGMGHLYRSDILPTIPRMTQNSSLSGVLGEVSNFPWPAPQLPGEWIGVNVPWTLPDTYCASGYYGDDPLSDIQMTDNSGWSCKSRARTNGQSFSVKGRDERKFTCSKIKFISY